ncbi:hypothetical protein C7212DRAFT_335491 [Tuber magnatum]|uniref:Uncharacterized protein n=1 Tax=Tuber magnatum TaxID=42249 RepID=A0A317SFD9_9PEZI|nr:hypothetical protein C7212DRAFT_335491 [Tuber magnatum]
MERLTRRNIDTEDLRPIVYISQYGEKADNGGFRNKARNVVSTDPLREELRQNHGYTSAEVVRTQTPSYLLLW